VNTENVPKVDFHTLNYLEIYTSVTTNAELLIN